MLRKIMKMAMVGMVILLMGCNNILENENSEYRILPNGYFFSDEEEKMVMQFALKKGYVSDDLRTVNINPTNDDIETMKAALIEEFGDKAYNYFGVERIEDETEVSSRTVLPNEYTYNRITSQTELGLVEPYNTLYGLKFYRLLDRNWGLFWDQITIKGYLKSYNKITNEEACFRSKKVTLTYEDEVTSKKNVVTTVPDNIDDDELGSGNKADSNSWKNGDRFYDELQYQTSLANVGIGEIKGKTKNGWWLPKIKWMKCNFKFEDDYLVNGFYSVDLSYKYND